MQTSSSSYLWGTMKSRLKERKWSGNIRCMSETLNRGNPTPVLSQGILVFTRHVILVFRILETDAAPKCGGVSSSPPPPQACSMISFLTWAKPLIHNTEKTIAKGPLASMRNTGSRWQGQQWHRGEALRQETGKLITDK